MQFTNSAKIYFMKAFSGYGYTKEDANRIIALVKETEQGKKRRRCRASTRLFNVVEGKENK